MTNQNIKKLVTAALLAAMTCVATMIIKIPTPTFGYIHPETASFCCAASCLVRFPERSAGIGSMFSDIFSGYVTWLLQLSLSKRSRAALPDCSSIILKHPAHEKGRYAALALCGIVGEAIMVIGYFLRNRTCRTRQRSLKPGIYRRRHCFLCDRYPV